MTAISGSLTAPTTGTYNFRWDNDDRGGMYVDLNGDGVFSSFEEVAPWAWASNGNLSLTAGFSYNFFYMTAEGNGGDTNNWYITQPSGSEERVNFGKASQLSMWTAAATDNILISTGAPVNIQVPADRNPTSWSATGLPSGLSINNSGVIGVTKGQRVIDWNQTFAGLVYGDSPLSLTATATGSGDLNYTSSDSDIIEINGTSAIIRGGGSVTLTATAAENATAFAATPVTKTISVAKAPLTITGQDLSLSVGDAIPDLNYTVTGWKHSDASLAIGANPSSLGLKLLAGCIR
jgi:hypothetical protein